MKVCSGGIVGLGEPRKDRIGLLQRLATMPIHSRICANQHVGSNWRHTTGRCWKLDVTEWIRTIAVARIIMPHSHIRPSAVVGQFLTQTKHLHGGYKLVSQVRNYWPHQMAGEGKDRQLFTKLGLVAEPPKPTVADLSLDAMALIPKSC